MLRFATSPIGDMHISDLRVAILNYLVAQQTQEHFAIRIDDTDTKRNIEGKDTEIMQILEKFALKHESVFHQSEHLHMHQTLAIKLLEEGKAFVCTCTSESIESDIYLGHCEHRDKSEYKTLKASNEPFVIRLKKPSEAIIYHDLIQGEINTIPDEVNAIIILDTQGLPTHNFASACDDMLSGISTIIKEKKDLYHTPKQIHIKNQLGYTQETQYTHISNLNDDDFSIQWLFEEGFIPDAILNYLILLGNTHTAQEIFTLPESISWFELKNISKTPVKFDIDKLRFINTQHLKFMDDKQLSSLFGFADEKIGQLAKVYLQEYATTKELQEKILPIFSPKDFSGKWGKEMRIIEVLIQDAPMFSAFSDFKAYILKSSNLTDEIFTKAFRVLLTGAEDAPELREIYPLINAYLLEVAS